MSFGERQKRLRKSPFEPFRIALSSGEPDEVRHSEMPLLLDGGIEVAEPDGRGELPEVAKWCSLLPITAIEPIPAKNGRPPRKK